MEKGRGVFTVTYLDNTVSRGPTEPAVIITPSYSIEAVVKILSSDYEGHSLSDITKEYLIGGVLIEVDEVGTDREYRGIVRKVSLYGETKTSLNLIAKALNLPDIPDSALIPRQHQILAYL